MRIPWPIGRSISTASHASPRLLTDTSASQPHLHQWKESSALLGRSFAQIDLLCLTLCLNPSCSLSATGGLQGKPKGLLEIYVTDGQRQWMMICICIYVCVFANDKWTCHMMCEWLKLWWMFLCCHCWKVKWLLVSDRKNLMKICSYGKWMTIKIV